MRAIYLLMIAVLGWGTQASWAIPGPTTREAATAAGARGVTEIEFSPGSDILSEDAKRELRDLMANSPQGGGEIRELKVAAWSDREYPAVDGEQPASEVRLATRRAQAVEAYLRQCCEAREMSAVNMAKRSAPGGPGFMSPDLMTDNARIKETLERNGAAPSGTADLGPMKVQSKAAHAVVLVF